MEKYELSLYLDFYDNLLTEHTRNVLSLAINEDLSITEIAEELGISRQAVYDRLDKGRKQLQLFESKMNLLAKNKQKYNLLKKIEDELQTKTLNKEKIMEIIAKLKEI